MSAGAELAVVVGASGSFGQAITQRLIGSGLGVVAVGRNESKLKALAAATPGVTPLVADIEDDGAIEAIRTQLAELDRPVRALVHGPGVLVAGGILEAPTEAIGRSVDIKVGGLLRLVRGADAHLGRGSRVIAIAGHYGLEPTPYAAAAGIANAALFSAVRQISLAYGSRGITAHTLAPGPADTERLHRVAEDRAKLQGITRDEVLDAMRADSSIGALTTPGQVAWAVAMLLAPEADAMTGSTLMLDSGRRKGLP